jgi:hypothetical protein
MLMATTVSAPVREADRAPQGVAGSDHVLEKVQGRGRAEEGPVATDSDARDAPAGPELDALVARVCGWPLVVEYGVFHKGSGVEHWGYSADQAARKVLMSARTADASRLISREVADSSPSTDLPEAMRAADAAGLFDGARFLGRDAASGHWVVWRCRNSMQDDRMSPEHAPAETPALAIARAVAVIGLRGMAERKTWQRDTVMPRGRTRPGS